MSCMDTGNQNDEATAWTHFQLMVSLQFRLISLKCFALSIVLLIVLLTGSLLLQSQTTHSQFTAFTHDLVGVVLINAIKLLSALSFLLGVITSIMASSMTYLKWLWTQKTRRGRPM